MYLDREGAMKKRNKKAKKPIWRAKLLDDLRPAGAVTTKEKEILDKWFKEVFGF